MGDSEKCIAHRLHFRALHTKQRDSVYSYKYITAQVSTPMDEEK